MQVKHLICNILLLFFITNVATVSASPLVMPGDIEAQRQKIRQDAQQRQERARQQDVFIDKPKDKVETDWPEEAVSFPISRIILEGAPSGHFSNLKRELRCYEGRKIGVEGVSFIIRQANKILLDDGFVTSRVLVKEQDLRSGVLRLLLMPGKIRNIRSDGTGSVVNWRTAFPVGEGNILNIRDLEQGLEQLKRIASREVDFQIVPADNAGESDIVITAKQGFPISVMMSVDDAGGKSTGKIQLSTTVTVDNPLQANDILRISLNHDGERNGYLYGSKGHSFQYSLPNGNWTYSLGKNWYKYRQTVDAVFDKFVFSGTSDDYYVSAEKLLHRTQQSKTYLEFGVVLKERHNYVNGSEITIQERKSTDFTIGIRQRRYIGQGMIDLGFSSKHGVPWFRAQSDPAEEIAELPTLRYHIWNLDITYKQPLRIGKSEAQYRCSIHGQYTKDRLYAADCLSMGNRYTVRGFDGEETLFGETGFYIQNELSIALPVKNQQFFVGLDYGRVGGDSTAGLDGQTLVGAVAGFRGSLGQYSQYEVFAGWALKKPEGMPGQPVYGFQYIAQL